MEVGDLVIVEKPATSCHRRMGIIDNILGVEDYHITAVPNEMQSIIGHEKANIISSILNPRNSYCNGCSQYLKEEHIILLCKRDEISQEVIDIIKIADKL